MSKEFETIALRKFEDIDKKFKVVDEKFDAIDKRFEAVDARFDAMDRRMDKMQEQLDLIPEIQEKISILPEIQRSLLLIEDQVMNKIPALFEAYSFQQQKQEMQQEDINLLNQKTENHDIRISYLEKKII